MAKTEEEKREQRELMEYLICMSNSGEALTGHILPLGNQHISDSDLYDKIYNGEELS